MEPVRDRGVLAVRHRIPPDRCLGGRLDTPKGVPSENGAWRVKAFRYYADYMAGEEFAAGLGELLRLAGHELVAIMCSEAVPGVATGGSSPTR
ncbi:hypothetical protein SGLAM104S_04451 [Streptomyces glaucescens]